MSIKKDVYYTELRRQFEDGKARGYKEGFEAGTKAEQAKTSNARHIAFSKAADAASMCTESLARLIMAIERY